MATWEKEKVMFELAEDGTGSNDSAVHTVELQPCTATYPTGAISCSQCSVVTYRWQPDSDLDNDIPAYKIYVDTQDSEVIIPSPKSQPLISI